MERFTIYPHPTKRGYLLNVQADAMGHLDSRVVIPLVPLTELPKPATRLNPLVDIDGEQYVMVTQSMGAVSVKLLKQGVGSLSDRYDEIVAAMDLLLQGF
ncbi:MAG: plasmid maintenance protein CcdB [Paraburkholderia sp.]|nr:MAG: plasmid maintenance protein CcdB [Paraburkholderia sp.]